MFVLGAGAGLPTNFIDNAFLSQLPSPVAPAWIDAHAGIQRRATVLPLEYIIATGNIDPRAGAEATLFDPTDLGVIAAKQAIERAGILPEQIGMVIGESATPLETTPSEGQRVAGILGLRVPSFDVCGGFCSLILQLDALASWKAEVVPDYVLLVSSNAPTMRINYSSGVERVFFGDAASALVISPKHAGKLLLKSVQFGCVANLPDLCVIDAVGHTHMQADFISEHVVAHTTRMLAEMLKETGVESNRVKFIGPQISVTALHKISQGAGLDKQQIVEVVGEQGFALGSAPGAAMAQNWDNFKEKDELLVAAVGSGLSFGRAHFCCTGGSKC
jgi:3-oxoacyl-[acyl-carrier-protein] synthase-3